MPITPAGDYLYYRDLADANSTALAPFVCRLDLSAANFDFTRVRPDGADIRVFDLTAGVNVPYWLEDFDPIGRRARLYFKATATGNPHRLYYGNPAGVPASSYASVFTHGSGFDADWGDLATATAGTHPQALRVPAGGDWATARGRQLWRRTKTPQIAGTSFGDLGARDLAITTDRLGQIVEDTPGTWVAYWGSTPLFDGTHWRKTVRTTSTDRGLTWSTPTLILSPDQSYDNQGAMVGTVVKVASNSYYMWYTATSSSGGIALAKSTDNLTWVKQGIQIPSNSGQIIDYAAGSVAVPDVRVMADGKWTMFTESRTTAGSWHVVGWTATSPDGPWTIMNGGHTVLDGQAGIWWGTDSFANPHVDELDGGGGYVLYAEGCTAHPAITDWNCQPGFLTSSTYNGPYTPDVTSPIAGRQVPHWGVETGALAVDATTRERILFVQDYYLEDASSPYSHLYRIWPIADRGGVLSSNSVNDSAAAGVALAAGTFTAESRSWMTAHRSEDSALSILELVDSAAMPAPDTSTNLAGIFRLGIRRMSFANASPGDIQFRYWDGAAVLRYWDGAAWGTSATSAAATDTNRDVLARIDDDGTLYRLSVVYADDGSPIASATIAKASVKAFTAGRFLLTGKLFTNTNAGGLFFRRISVRPYAAVEPAFTAGMEVPLTPAVPGTASHRLLENGASRLLESGAFRLLESGAPTPTPGTDDHRLLESGYARLLESGTFRLLESGAPTPTPTPTPTPGRIAGRRLLESGGARLTEDGGRRLLEGSRVLLPGQVARYPDPFGYATFAPARALEVTA